MPSARNRYRGVCVAIGIALAIVLTVVLLMFRPEPITVAAEGTHDFTVGVIFMPAFIGGGAVLGIKVGDALYRRRHESNRDERV